MFYNTTHCIILYNNIIDNNNCLFTNNVVSIANINIHTG